VDDKLPAENRPTGLVFGDSVRLADALPFIAALSPSTVAHVCSETGDLGDCQLSDLKLGQIQAAVGLQQFAQVLAEAALTDSALEAALNPIAPPVCPLVALIPSLRLLQRELIPTGLSTRTCNALRRSGIWDWGKLAELSLGNIRELRNVGMTSITEVFAFSIEFGLRSLLAAGELPASGVDAEAFRGTPDDITEFFRNSEWGDQSDSRVAADGTPAQSPTMVLDGSVVTYLKVIAAWGAMEQEADSLADSLAKAVNADDTAPAAVKNALAHLLSVDARSFASDYLRQFDADAAADECLGGVRDAFDILFARELAVAERTTLGDIADGRGVSRERVRQIESERIVTLKKCVHLEENQVLLRAASRLHQELGDACPLQSALELHPDLTSNHPADLASPTLRRLRLLLWLAGPYKVADGRLVRGNTAEVVQRTTASLDQITHDNAVPLPDAIRAVTEAGVAERFARWWLGELDGFRILEGEVVRWKGTLLDKAEVVLRRKGAPMTADELTQEIGSSGSAGFASRLYDDARFVRTGVRNVGLREWGLEEYTTVQDAMTREVERQGGEATVDHLVAVLPQRFQVSESSVRMYAAQNLAFVRTPRGTVRLRTAADPMPESRSIELSKRCFRLEDGWAFRVTISSDVMRGSGSPASPGFVSHCGVNGLGSVTLQSPSGPVTIGRSASQNWIGSLRQAAIDLDGEVGDYLFVELTGSNQLRFRLVRSRELADVTPPERLALEVGARLDAWSGDVLDAVCHAVGLPAGEAQSPLRDVTLRLQARGDGDLVDMLERSVKPAQDDASLLELMTYVLGRG
jgi:hypothetical protein